MPIDFSKNRDKDIEEITEKLFAKLQKQGLVAEEIGEQVGESFADGIEQGFEDAASRIEASSVKITKAFKDLAKKITNQKISLGGIDIDFSDIDIDSTEFQEKINKAFEKIRIDSGIEFDSKDAEKQFKNMLGMHVKYADKLSKLQEQKPKLTNPESIKANAKEQLAIIDGLKEIRRAMNDVSDISISLPHAHFGDVKALRAEVDLLDQIAKGEEKIGKQRDTNNKKLQEENKKLKEKNELYEEKYGALQEESTPKPKKPRAKKSNEPSEENVMRQRGEEMKAFATQFEGLQKELGDTSKWFGRFNDYLNQIQQGALTAAEAVAKLRDEMAPQKTRPSAPVIPSVDEILAEFKEDVKPHDADDIGNMEAENGALKDRLGLLRELAEEYGSEGLTKDAKAYYKLWLKEMDGQEFTDAQDERYSETSENLEAAAQSLVNFEKTYDKIIVKFGKGKDLEILPNAKGLADLAKINEEYGEAYNGKEISDVIFVRTKESVEEAVRAAEEAAAAERARLEEEVRLQEEARKAEEARRAEAERLAREQEEAERRALELARQRAEEEARIATEKEKQLAAEKHYYPINEDAAKRAKEANSFGDYVPGSATAEYRKQIDAARQLVEQKKASVDSMYHEKIDQLFDTYARQLAENMNKSFEIDARMPSILISGGGNFNVGKKQKQNAARDRNMEEWNHIQGLLDKIRIIGTGGISADDDQAVAKLEAKLKTLMEAQQLMKDVNAYFRKHGTLDGFEGLSKEEIEKLKAEMNSSWHLDKTKPFQSFSLQNNNAEIRRVKARIEELKKHEAQEYPEWEFEGGHVKANKEVNRIQIFFDGKPADDVREQMRANAFKWSPKEGAWQRQLNDNAYRAMDNIDAIQPDSGEKPYEMLRKAKAEQKQMVEEIAAVETKAGEQAITAEQTQIGLVEDELKVEKEIVQLTDNYGKSLDEVNNKLMQGTKLLNEQGQVLRLFHNSPEVFDTFDASKSGSNQGQALGAGNYLALRQNGEFNNTDYGRYQTQWYANVQNPFNARDKLTSEQASSVIDKFLADKAEGFKNHMLSKLLDGDVVTAIKDIAYESKVAVGDVFAHLGYDAVMDGAQINVFDPSKIHRANDSVLDVCSEEFAAFNELQKKMWEEQKIIENAKTQIKKLSNQYEGQDKSQLEDALFTETLFKGWGWQENVGKIASAFRELTGELPKTEDISEETMQKLADNYEFAKQNLQSYKDSVDEHEKVLDELSKQFIAHEAKVHEITQAYLNGSSNVSTKKTRVLKFTSAINDKSGKFKIKPKTPEVYETDSGQMSILPAVEAETDAKNELANANEKVAKSQKKVNDAYQGEQLSIDDIIPSGANLTETTLDEADEWLNGPKETQTFDKVGEAAEKAVGKKKKFAKASKEVADSVGSSVSELKTEVDAIEDVGEAAAKTNKTISEEARRSAENMSFSTRDYEALYEEMEAFAAQRKAENGYDLSKVTVNTDAHGKPLGATIAYYKKATKESIVETFKLDKATQEVEEGVNRLVLSSRKATAGVADFEKATLQAINRQDQLIAQKNKTVSSLSAVLDPNSNRTLAGTDYEEEANRRIQAIKDEVAKLDQVDSAGERIILPEKDFLTIKRRIAELTQDARDFINASKNAEYAPTQLESHSVSSGNKYRKDQLNAYVNEWKKAGIYAGDLQAKAEELAGSVDNITKHEDLKKYLEGMKEARALAKLATQDKKSEEDRQKSLNAEYKEYMKLIRERNAIEKRMIGVDDEELLAPLRELYNKKDNEINSKYGSFLSREDVQKHFNLQDFTDPQDEAELEMEFARRKAAKKKKLEEEAAAQKVVNEAYAEYKRLMGKRESKRLELVGLDPTKNKEQIDTVTAQIDEIDAKLNATYGDLLSNKVAQATLTLEDFMKYYDEWQQKIADKEAKAKDKARNKEEAPYRNYGKTTANATQRKQGDLNGAIESLGVTDPKTLAQIGQYNAKVKEVIDLREQFANDPKAAQDPKLVKQFQKASYEAEQLRRGIKSIVDEEQQMMQESAEQGFAPMKLSADQIANLKNEMASFAQAEAQGRIEIKGFNDDNTKMYYTVTNAKGSVEEMTVALGQGTNHLYKMRTATKETGTLMQQIFKGVKVKAKELISYVIGGGTVYKVIGMLKQGIQYVREIDLALTELKKVTDETEETYKKFLDTAAKTADKVGSTIQKVVSSTADWARLGYSMEEAAKFAETTQILMNVSEFTDVSQATDTLISSVQAFGYTAETSMDVVDLLNTIGK